MRGLLISLKTKMLKVSIRRSFNDNPFVPLYLWRPGLTTGEKYRRATEISSEISFNVTAT